MNKLIKKLMDKKKRDPAHFTKQQLEERDKKQLEDIKKDLKEREIKDKQQIKYLKKELPKYEKDKKKFLKLNDAINDRFKVSSTDTKAAIYGAASVYFNALEISNLPEDYYPEEKSNDPEFLMTPDDEHYWLWNFQMNTSDNKMGHSIPDRPGDKDYYVIHAFLFAMTSTIIFLNKWNEQFLVRYEPNDELFGREWGDKTDEKIFDKYDGAIECFENFIEKHLDSDEEKYYELKKKIT
jgi:hypothetical protein